MIYPKRKNLGSVSHSRPLDSELRQQLAELCNDYDSFTTLGSPEIRNCAVVSFLEQKSSCVLRRFFPFLIKLHFVEVG